MRHCNTELDARFKAKWVELNMTFLAHIDNLINKKLERCFTLTMQQWGSRSKLRLNLYF